jgi:hypothetical protein
VLQAGRSRVRFLMVSLEFFGTRNIKELNTHMQGVCESLDMQVLSSVRDWVIILARVEWPVRLVSISC